ncbi:lipopolysaccharide biosynthesis protein [Actinomycetospora aeridis]|uniref:O-antigen/teichoic acid export membrane protein n=1 Tax=Actinomycetospora aeridis TaxID=3129231 RepID=A0ABU8N2M7_9PSEU
MARILPPAEYATFGAFWALAMVLGFGAFLPLEQELARRLPQLGDRRSVLRAGAGAAGVLALVALGVLALASPLVLRSFDGNVSSFVALAALCVVSAGQFLVRGAVIGTDRLVRHGGIMVLDALLRLGLAVLVFLLGGADSAALCWALVLAVALAHLPQLPAVWRRAVADSPPSAPDEGVSPRRFVAACLPLLLGSVCAQLLLNGLPVLVVAQSPETAEAAAGAFVAAFTLVKAPLAMVVPLQSAIVPTLTRLIVAGRRPEVLALLFKGGAALLGLIAVAVPVMVWLGPPVIALVFGDDYAIGGGDLALMAAGVLAHVGLVVVTQVHVARGRHGVVALSWAAALATAGLTWALVPAPVLGAELAFLAGSVAGAVVSGAALMMRPERPGRTP